MIKLETLKSKTFWGGVANVAAGAWLATHGSTELGVTLIALGFTAITGSDRATKILAALKNK